MEPLILKILFRVYTPLSVPITLTMAVFFSYELEQLPLADGSNTETRSLGCTGCNQQL